jgi:hypothetical protein
MGSHLTRRTSGIFPTQATRFGLKRCLAGKLEHPALRPPPGGAYVRTLGTALYVASSFAMRRFAVIRGLL